MAWFKKAPVEASVNEEVPVEPQAEVKTAAAPVVFNPAVEESLEFANYRADAIARCIEQRRGEMMPRHPDHDMMVGEAMSYAYMLVQHGKWAREKLEELATRLKDSY